MSPILNYTTKVRPEKTVAEIQKILGRCRAVETVSIQYTEGEPTAILFAIGVAGNTVRFRLPCNVTGVQSAMARDRLGFSYRTKEHATCVAWRIVKDWVEAQMALVDANQAQMAEVFLPYAVVHEDGSTMFKMFEKQVARGLLTAGDAEPEVVQ